MKADILNLRADGKTYTEIKKQLGCSLGTIAYYCGDGQKDKNGRRQRQYLKSTKAILKRKKDNFSRIIKNGKRHVRIPSEFSSRELFDKITNNPVCYLTGRKIDLSQPLSYQFDHVVPVSKGGSNGLSNLELSCSEANRAKSNLSKEEFLDLCIEVVRHHGYSVEKVIGAVA